MKLTQFKIKNTPVDVLGEYEGNQKSGKVIIFSHGFGVTRNNHELFIEIGDLLKDKYLIVRFDYNKFSSTKKSLRVYPYSDQVVSLRKVIDFIHKNFDISEVNIVAHSMGCCIVGMLQPDNVKKVFLSAGPTEAPYKNFKEYFSKRPGTVFNETGLSKIQRSDGSFTVIGKEFWKDIKDIDPIPLYFKLAKNSEVYYVRAKKDQIITDTNYKMLVKNSNINYFEIDGGHDFHPPAREELLSILEKIFNE